MTARSVDGVIFSLSLFSSRENFKEYFQNLEPFFFLGVLIFRFFGVGLLRFRSSCQIHLGPPFFGTKFQVQYGGHCDVICRYVIHYSQIRKISSSSPLLFSALQIVLYWWFSFQCDRIHFFKFTNAYATTQKEQLVFSKRKNRKETSHLQLQPLTHTRLMCN